MYCKKCGEKLDEEDRYCSFCGSRIERKEPLNTLEAELTYKQINSMQKARFDAEWEREERREKYTFMVFGALIVVLVLAISGGVAFLLRNDKATEQDFFSELTPESSINQDVDITPELMIPTEPVLPDDTDENAMDSAQKKEYVIYDSNVRYLVSEDLDELSAWELRIARNEIFARHGRMFDVPEIKEYFESKSWYKPSVLAVEFDNSCLNKIEMENLNFIILYEKTHNLY